MRRPSPADRKSTRLNSSHSQISYAVFCLKKKKNYNHTSLGFRCGRCSFVACYFLLTTIGTHSLYTRHCCHFLHASTMTLVPTCGATVRTRSGFLIATNASYTADDAHVHVYLSDVRTICVSATPSVLCVVGLSVNSSIAATWLLTFFFFFF